MGVPIKFNLRDIIDLNEDIRRSPKALPIIVQRVMSIDLRELARQMRPLVPRGTTGQLARSFTSSVTRPQGMVKALFGFVTRRRLARTIVAGNVLQKGGASPRKRAYLWVPTRSNRNMTPAEFFAADNTFIRMNKTGNKAAYIRQGNIAVAMFTLHRFIKLGAPPVPIDERVEARLPAIMENIETTITETLAARRAALASFNQ